MTKKNVVLYERVFMTVEGSSLLEIKDLARRVRIDVLNMVAKANSGHPGGSLSETDILAVLYGKVMKHDPSKPNWVDRDRFILSKAHACPGLYAVLAETGYFEIQELDTFRQIDSRIQGHAHIKTPGVEMSGGSLGQGLSFGVGVSLAVRLNGRKSRTYVLLGDGECDEGQIWEAAMSASHHGVDNLVAIVDRNRIQNDRWTYEVMSLEPFVDKWKSFGWHVLEIDGHSIDELIDAFETAEKTKGRPSAIIANTLKGKGVSFMENNADFHGKAPSPDELLKALKELGSEDM